jgi:hypothetical protein
MDLNHTTCKSPSVNHQENRNSSDKEKLLAVNYRPLLTKSDSIDLDCEWWSGKVKGFAGNEHEFRLTWSGVLIRF